MTASHNPSKTAGVGEKPATNAEAGFEQAGEQLSEPTLRLIGGIIVILGCAVFCIAVWLLGWSGIIRGLVWVCTAALGFAAVYVAWSAFSPATDGGRRGYLLAAGAARAAVSLAGYWGSMNMLERRPAFAGTASSAEQPSQTITRPPTASRGAIATQQNWLRIGKVLDGLESVENCGQQQTLPRLISCLEDASGAYSNASAQLARLPVRDVDPEVVSLAADSMRLLSRTSALFGRLRRIYSDRQRLESYANSPEAIVESAVRGFLGDPLGKYYEVQKHSQQLGTEFKDAQREMRMLSVQGANLRADAHRIRAAMRAKYGVEFRPIE